MVSKLGRDWPHRPVGRSPTIDCTARRPRKLPGALETFRKGKLWGPCTNTWGLKVVRGRGGKSEGDHLLMWAG